MGPSARGSLNGRPISIISTPDSSSLIRVIQAVQPDEIYNLAAQSHVAVSFEEPEYTANSDALGALRVLEAIRILGLEKKYPFLYNFIYIISKSFFASCYMRHIF